MKDLVAEDIAGFRHHLQEALESIGLDPEYIQHHYEDDEAHAVAEMVADFHFTILSIPQIPIPRKRE